MSYLVLARKWRPKRFAELVGQEHVVRALTNALDSGRVHHAFLFTGTRGVGKTTIARIFAKSLNCEQGTSADPCGACETCLAIDAGRYIDLLEIDAASNTGVDDVREVIENAQYMPSRGKFKVYLVDEVHMLSKAAFNALLKTLEEPPEHVKFLLATTDPQKLPVTVLSRCLQFNLKRLDEAQISGQISKILTAEEIPADDGAIKQIAKAADGSLRDGLSLLDQAIAYSGAGAGGRLDDAQVAAMLGTVDRTQVGAMLEALADSDGQRLLDTVAHLADFSPDWSAVLEALAEGLHRIQVKQLVPSVAEESDGVDAAAFAARLRPEVVQLWYQMALNGRRDLPYAPSARAGFEMSVLRMLAFRPAQAGDMSAGGASTGAVAAAAVATPAASASAVAVSTTTTTTTTTTTATDDLPPWVEATPLAPKPQAPVAAVEAKPAPKPAQVTSPAAETDNAPIRDVVPPAPPVLAPVPPVEVAPLAVTSVVPLAVTSCVGIEDAEAWFSLVSACGLKGPSRQLADNAAFIAYGNQVLKLALAPGFEYLQSDRSINDLAGALAPLLGGAPKIVFETGAAKSETRQQREHRQRDARQSEAEEDFMNHPDVQRLIQQHGARVVADSIRPLED